MLKILINASDRVSKSVQLLKIESDKSTVIAEKIGNINLVSALKELLAENNLQSSQIDNYEFADGVGSFTGIKMAAAVANIMNWAIKNVSPQNLKMPAYNSEPNIQKKETPM